MEAKPRDIYAPGFRPAMKRISATAETVDAILNAAGGSERRIGACSTSGGTGRRIGTGMVFSVPSGLEVRHYADDDYWGDRIAYAFRGKIYTLATMTGPFCCSGRPVKDDDVIAAFPTVRTWVFRPPSGQPYGGLDLRGEASDGKWRWLGPVGGNQIEYRGVPDEVARVFDAIIDSLCIVRK